MFEQLKERGEVFVLHRWQRVCKTSYADWAICICRGVGGKEFSRDIWGPVRVGGALSAIG